MVSLIQKLEDIQVLIDGKVEESLILDYKQALWPKNSEIAKDVSSFANTEGGTIVVGVECRGVVPTRIVWVEPLGIEEKIQNIIATTFSPTLQGVNISTHSNLGDDTKSVIVVEIPQSFDAPHMVNDRYYKRQGSTSRPMSHEEVKNGMLGVGRIRALRYEASQNVELAESTISFVSRIYAGYTQGPNREARNEVVFTPFHIDAWSAVRSGGFLFAFPEKVVQTLMIAYSKIHDINSFFDSIKGNTHGIVHSAIYESSMKYHGTYSLAILNTKLPELKRSLEDLQSTLGDL